MPIALFFFCSLLLGTSLGQQYGSNRTVNEAFGTLADMVNQGLDLPHKGVKLTTKLTNSAVEHGANIAKMGAATGATLSSQGLGGGTDLGKQGLDIVGTVGEIIPGAGGPVNYLTNASKMVLTVGNNLGQKGIKATNDLENQVIDNTKTVTKITTGTLENLSSAGTELAKDSVKTSLNALANVGNIGMDAAKAFVPGTQSNQVPEVPPKVPEPTTAKPEPTTAKPEPTPEPSGTNSYLQSAWSYISGN